ncbi:hypothetical protein BC826DRAFT_1044645 [Russula brevipes]|nr:hypothetical protein BC826DRAFT_1044645 [Russula brevipes]
MSRGSRIVPPWVRVLLCCNPFPYYSEFLVQLFPFISSDDPSLHHTLPHSESSCGVTLDFSLV